MREKAQRSVVCLFPESKIEGLEDFRQQYIINPGKSVPFHVTILSNFLLPEQIDEETVNKLKEIAQSTPKFDFMAKPLSSFPTTKVLYLTPSPASPIEELSEKLYKAFPQFHNPQYGFPVFHMTIALGNPDEEKDQIVGEYFEKFGRLPLVLKAGHLGIYVQYGNQWKEYLCIKIG